MPFIDGRCPLCGETMKVPEGSDSCFCSSCGKQVMSEAAIAFAPNANGTALTAPANATNVSDGQSAPFLETWKTSPGLVAIGIIIIIFVNSATNVAARNVTDWNTALIIFIVSIAFSLACLIYSVFVYPSFFKSEPLIKSNAVASFMNGLMGGLIFGCLWCSNLTNKKKGVSYIVYAILIAAALVISFAPLFV